MVDLKSTAVAGAGAVESGGNAGTGGNRCARFCKRRTSASVIACRTREAADSINRVVRVICVRKMIAARPRNDVYLFSNFGGRFSMKACMPSPWSAVANSE